MGSQSLYHAERFQQGRPRWTVVMCLERLLYIWRPSVINMPYCVASLLSFLLTPDPTILPLLSHTHPTSKSSKFQLIFDNALKAYKKRTKIFSPTRSLTASKPVIRLAAFSPCFKNKSRSSISLNAAMRSGSTQQ